MRIVIVLFALIGYLFPKLSQVFLFRNCGAKDEFIIFLALSSLALSERTRFTAKSCEKRMITEKYSIEF